MARTRQLDLPSVSAHGQAEVSKAVSAFAAEVRARHGTIPPALARLLARIEDGPLPISGVVHLRCPACAHTRRIPFRRSGELGLLDKLPPVPLRHWVFSLPRDMRARLALDHRLARRIGRAFIQCVFAWQRRQAKHEFGLRGVECGSVTVTQRLGGALNLNVHFHALVSDGVFVRQDDGSQRFHRLAAPAEADFDWIVARARGRAREIVRTTRAPDDSTRALVDLERILEAPRAEVKETAARPEVDVPKHRRGGTDLAGYHLHADETADGRDRAALGRLCEYLSRPPIDARRLDGEPDGALRYRLKTRVGREASVRLSPSDLGERIAGLIPNAEPVTSVAYHGTFARRAAVVQRPQVEFGFAKGRGSGGGDREPRPRVRTPPGDAEDMLRCDRCLATMQVVAVEDGHDRIV